MADRKKGRYNTRQESSELRKLDIEALQSKLAEERNNLMRARFEHATAQLENTASLKTTRQKIARIETIINEKSPKAKK